MARLFFLPTWMRVWWTRWARFTAAWCRAHFILMQLTQMIFLCDSLLFRMNVESEKDFEYIIRFFSLINKNKYWMENNNKNHYIAFHLWNNFFSAFESNSMKSRTLSSTYWYTRHKTTIGFSTSNEAIFGYTNDLLVIISYTDIVINVSISVWLWLFES